MVSVQWLRWLLCPHQVCSNGDCTLTFDLFTPRSNLHQYTFIRGKCWKIKFSKCIKDNSWNLKNKTFQLQSKFCPLGVIYSCPWAIFMYKLSNIFSETAWSIFTRFDMGSCQKDIGNLLARRDYVPGELMLSPSWRQRLSASASASASALAQCLSFRRCP